MTCQKFCKLIISVSNGVGACLLIDIKNNQYDLCFFFWGGAKNERKFIASVLDNFFTLCSSHLFQNDKKKFSRMQLIKSQIKIFIFKIT